ncbi:MAG TPA: adenylate kinase [Enterococcus columbae]|nr:adenylate kinase [Enterococcus columbae]
MQKIVVIGCPGAGKSTFARKLRDKLQLPLYYLDQLWHRADQTTITMAEFIEAQKAITKQACWIIDGNYLNTLELRLAACDTVFFLDLPSEVCFESVKQRIGQPREDMPWIEEEFDNEFQQWILDFPVVQRPAIWKLLAEYSKEKAIIVFHDRKDVNEYFEN